MLLDQNFELGIQRDKGSKSKEGDSEHVIKSFSFCACIACNVHSKGMGLWSHGYDGHLYFFILFPEQLELL